MSELAKVGMGAAGTGMGTGVGAAGAGTGTGMGTGAGAAGAGTGAGMGAGVGAAGAGTGAGMVAAGALAMYEAKIQLYKEQAVTGYIGIGRTLNEAKAAGVVPHGQWEEWVERTTGLRIRQAQRCMQAASEIREGSFLGQIDMSKAILLLSSGLDEGQKEDLGKLAAEGATVRELREKIRKLQAGADRDAEQHRKQMDALRAKAEEDMEKARKQVDALWADEVERYRKQADALREGAEKELAQQKEEIRQLKLDKVQSAGAVTDIRAKLRETEQQRKELEQQIRALDAGMKARMDEEVGRAYKRGLTDKAAGMEKEIRDGIRKEYEGKISFVNSQRLELEEARKDLMARLEEAQKAGSKKWDEGYKAAMAQAEGSNQERDELARQLRDMKEELEEARNEMEAMEDREARRAQELAALKKEKAQAEMDAARGIRADVASGMDLAAAVRSFIGAAGVLPQMGQQLSRMNETDRGAILAQVDTVARWVEGARKALGVVSADASIM